jgi:hypothetical protein
MYNATFGLQNSRQVDTDALMTRLGKPKPNMSNLGSRYKDKNHSKIRKLGNDLVTSYKKRTLSYKSKEQDVLDIARGYQLQQQFNEPKYHINNISPNYPELNKIAMNKIKLVGRDTNTELESKIFEINSIKIDTKYKVSRINTVRLYFNPCFKLQK